MERKGNSAMRRFSIILLAALALAACSKHPAPPQGRWVGNYESPAVMVDAWLEILPNGTVRVSAPDLTDIGAPTDEERVLLQARLASQLADGWGEVEPRKFDFDGRVFRKPGGVAPQMEWNPKTRQMKVVFYFGKQHSLRIVMHPVKDFDEDPWGAESRSHQS
jgi:hypothetical protein